MIGLFIALFIAVIIVVIFCCRKKKVLEKVKAYEKKLDEISDDTDDIFSELK